MTTLLEQESLTPSQSRDESAAPAAVSPMALLGTWTNIDHATRSLVKVVINAAGAGISVTAFGACKPTPCYWGMASGIAYSTSVSSPEAVAFTAQYRFSFAQVILTGHLQGTQLALTVFTHFTDGSGRADFLGTDILSK